MLCFNNPGTGSSSKKKQKKGALLGDRLAYEAIDGSSEAKMTRTQSAPPSFLHHTRGSCSPLFKVRKERDGTRNHQAASSSPPVVPHSATLSSTSGYNSLAGGFRREAIFRGEPLPLPTPESCGFSADSSLTRPFSFPSPLPQSSSQSFAFNPRSSYGVSAASSSSSSLPRPAPSSSSTPVACPPPAAHIRFSPETACIGESGSGPAFRCSLLLDNAAKSKETDAVLVRLLDPTMQDPKASMQELKLLASLRHANLSKILGFSFTSEEKLVVYESQANGSLDKLLYGRTRNRPPLDWFLRINIALDAAKGLSYLVEKSPNKLVYKDFRTFNVHVDNEFRGKLVGYGFARRDVDAESPMVAAYAAPELISNDAPVTDRSIVWSFGVVLLEILTGRQNRDEIFPAEQQDLVQWTAPHLINDKSLFLVVDPELKGVFPAKSVASVARLASQCLQVQAASRPSMDQVVQRLEMLVQVEGSANSSGGNNKSSSRKPLIEALKEGSSSPLSSPCPSPSTVVSLRQTTSFSMQKKLATRLARNLCVAAD